MNARFTLDVPSFQKLLEAAWVLQCERDLGLSESHHGVTVLTFPSDKEELNGLLPLSSPGNVLEPARAVAEADTQQIREIVDPSVVPNPLTVAPIYRQGEVAGALALAADRNCSSLRDPIPFPGPDVFKKAARVKNETPVAEISRWASLSLVKEPSLSTRTASNLKRASQVAAAYAGPVVVLLIMLAFLFSQLGIHRPALTSVKAAPLVPRIAVDKIAIEKIAVDESPTRDDVGQTHSPVATGSENPRNVLPALEPAVHEPSHLRVTDPAASSLVEGLSRYEMQTVRHQAQYGDDVAALTLGMAYEIGRHVPRSCTHAAHWVAVAAEEGNSAAQYNLALRYLSGDGTPTNRDEARKWLEKAAGRGYQKARLTLRASHL
jgi:TPR repeat protein